MKYKAVIFDLNGTLIDAFSQQEYESVLSEMATIINAPPDEFTRIWLGTFNERITGKLDAPEGIIRHVCEVLNLEATGEEMERAVRVDLEYTARRIIPRPSSIEIIKQLRSNGYKTGLITDCSFETPKTWPDTAFASLFDVTVFSCIAGIKKPNPRIYLIATGQLGVKPQECIYIGDGDSNELSGALQVGMNPVLIKILNKAGDSYFINPRENWNGSVISSFSEVLSLLE